MEKGYVCFISDVHLGLKVGDAELRERRLVSVIESLPPETIALYLLGDIFDFWYEYKYVVPKGYTRFFGALSKLSDRGVKLFFFKGNHDVWAFGYFKEELRMEIPEQPYQVMIGGKRFCLAHGDGLDGEDKGYILLKSIFNSKILQKLFSNIHPRWAFALANRWSVHNRLTKGDAYQFKGAEEPLYKYVCRREMTHPSDYYIFGHLHTPGNITTPGGGKMYVLGEWINGCDYLLYEITSDSMEWRSGRD
jgi:UDP-2,3-diacylglucosamine hydrolase